MSQRNIRVDILIPGYIEYRLNREWVDWFRRSLAKATPKINQDLRPFAVFQMLLIWNKQFSPGLANIFKDFSRLNMNLLLAPIVGITLALFYIFYRRRNKNLIVVYSIATTGFFGMLVNFVLIFSFQVFYGYLFHKIGILISVFMAGLALGSIIIIRVMKNLKNKLTLFIKLELVIATFSLGLPWIISRFGSALGNAYGVFVSLFLIPGFLVGLEFPLASNIYMEKSKKVGETSGVLYGSDLLGSWLAGVFGGIILLPVLGLFNTCMVIVLLKLSSLFLLLLGGTLLASGERTTLDWVKERPSKKMF
jgi:spermidine synthase